MEWRYYGLQIPFARRQLFGQRLLNVIHELHSSHRLPAVRCSGKIYNTCYVFVAHLEDEDELPEGTPELVEEALRSANQRALLGDSISIFRPHDHHGGFTLPEVQKFSAAGFTTDVVGNLVALFRSPVFANEPPAVLDLSLPLDDPTEEPNPAQTARYERLLAWASAVGGGSWDRFAGACAALGLAARNETSRLRALVRRLMLLGHLQIAPDEKSWAMCPLALAEFEGDPGRVFWCGPRTAALRAELVSHFGPVEELRQPGDAGPPRLAFRTTLAAVRSVKEVCDLPLRAVESPARRLAAALPDFPAWIASLRSDAGIHTAAFTDVRRFDGEQFATPAHPYEQDGRVVGTEGLYQLAAEQGAAAYRYLDAGGVWRSGDYPSMRYAGWAAARPRSLAGVRVDGAAIVPLAQQWPSLHQRCLTLATGLLPKFAIAARTLTYPGVGRDLLSALQTKLPFDVQEPDDA